MPIFHRIEDGFFFPNVSQLYYMTKDSETEPKLKPKLYIVLS